MAASESRIDCGAQEMVRDGNWNGCTHALCRLGKGAILKTPRSNKEAVDKRAEIGLNMALIN
jgi:hypothetical protein